MTNKFVMLAKPSKPSFSKKFIDKMMIYERSDPFLYVSKLREENARLKEENKKLKKQLRRKK